MSTLILSLGLIAVFIAILVAIGFLKKKKKSFNFRVLTALAIGLVFGLVIQLGLGTSQTYMIDNNGNEVTNFIDAQEVDQTAPLPVDEDGKEIPVYLNFEANGIEPDMAVQYFGTDASNYEGLIYTSETNFEGGELTFVKSASTANGNLMTFMSIFSGIYVSLLKLIVIPLIFISITTAIINSRGKANLGKKVSKVIGVLLVTVAISAVIGLLTSVILGIDGATLVSSMQNTQEATARAATIAERSSSFTSMNYADLIKAPIPSDFSFFVGQGDTAALTTVLFGMFLGYAVLQVDKRYPERVALFIDFLNSTKEVVLSMVREILKLTPFAIVALMASFMATTNFAGMSQLLLFVVGTYVAIIVMYIIHLLILVPLGLNPVVFAKKTFPVLLFGFGSRSSMAALSMNTQTQQEGLGVDEMSADLSATFGATIGQNGCAGIYPAMVAIMAAQAFGVDITISWIILLILVITISSFGIAGVGGGATFAAIAVLSMMGLPVTVAAILISVEPLLDMARTALNISDAMLTGTVVSKVDGELDEKVYNA